MKLKKIMEIRDPSERSQKLESLAKELGVGTTRIVDAYTGKVEEHILLERINQGLLIQNANKMWIVALCSARASVISAITGFIVVFNSLPVGNRLTQ